jgi:hypothetical protein
VGRQGGGASGGGAGGPLRLTASPLAVKLVERVAHALRKPPRVIAWKVWQKALQAGRSERYWSRLAEGFRKELDAAGEDGVQHQLATAPLCLASRELAGIAALLPPDVQQALVQDADDTVALRFSYLGWTRQFEALPLPWRSDWKSGREWELRLHHQIEFRASTDGSDVKSCWEPSRFHFAVRLGQAYRLTGNPRYAEHFHDLLEDWRQQNPLACSINWTSPLEVGIRVVNLASALALAAPALGPRRIRGILHDVAIHGAFIARNLEYTDVRGNHYTGNLLGLLVAGALLDGVVEEAGGWFKIAAERIPEEILLQYTPDGVNHEKSVPYHRFVTEMFLLAGIVLERAGRPLSAPCLERLAAAVRFTSACIRPDGTTPIIGDNDNARALPLFPGDPVRHGHLLPLGRELLGPLPGLGGGDPWEAVWVGGRIPEDAEGTRGSQCFPDGGFYVGRVADHHLMVDAGSVGLQSGGCHGHHDMLSFDLALGGVAVVVDPGMPAYTGNRALHECMRRTRAHNTAEVDGEEQGSFPAGTWHLGDEAEPRDVSCRSERGSFHFSGAHVGYMRFPFWLRHRRTLSLFPEGLTGADRFESTVGGTHRICVRFHLAAGLEARPAGSDRVRVGGAGMALVLEFTHVGEEVEGEVQIEDDLVSPGYGQLLPSSTVAVHLEGRAPFRLDWRIGTGAALNGPPRSGDSPGTPLTRRGGG